MWPTLYQFLRHFRKAILNTRRTLTQTFRTFNPEREVLQRILFQQHAE
jgi:hypothetical protein